MRAWYRGSFDELMAAQPRAIAAELSANAASRRLSPNPESLDAWTASIARLQETAASIVEREPAARSWHCFLEFEVPRRSRRIDAVVLADDVIFVLEWKVGASRFDRAAIWQTEQYALDLRDFHEGSRGRCIVPLLIASEAESQPGRPVLATERLAQEVQLVAPAGIADAILAWWRETRIPGAPTLDPVQWEHAPYRPTPTIIEAARILYEGHDVRDISLSGAQNLDETVAAVLDLIEQCRSEGRRGIAFITGAPGSGKTLAGLQVVHTAELVSHASAVFLSGNMPLVEVISTAIANSAAQQGATKRHAQREVRTFIQHAYQFRNEYAETDQPPSEHVILFDEAQRAWDRRQVERWTRGASTRSEPEIFLDVMNRKPEWSVVIALVGSGQEINTGEAGLSEWGRALQESHPDWIVRASPRVLPGHAAPPGGRLFEETPATVELQTDDRLHLLMNVRSPRAERLNQWVDSLLSLDLNAAREAFPDEREFPLVMTRDLPTAKDWLRTMADDQERAGLLASSEGRRLRAWGIDTRTLRQEKAWADWFLRPRSDVRGSSQLEVAATNFDCQGLEIDWAGVCWANDLVPRLARLTPSWQVERFIGSRWTRANEERSRYIINGYRVLLTRARRGQVIWVPRPDGTDATLPLDDFDAIADYLSQTGVPSLD